IRVPLRMNPATRFPLDREVAPEIGHCGKGTRMGREDVTLRRAYRTSPGWPLQPSAIKLHSIHQVHRNSDEHIFFETIVRSRIIPILPTEWAQIVLQPI